MEKDRTIALLKEHNARYIQEIDRQNEVARFAHRIIIAVQDFQQAKSRQSNSSSNYQDSAAGGIKESKDSEALGHSLNGTISDIMHIYNQT